MPPPHAIVVGAGAGGLSAAIELASRGLAVTVIEMTDRPGGKIRSCDRSDIALDVGPTVFTMRWVFEALFARAGRSLADHITLRPLEVLAHHRWSDGDCLNLYSDTARTAAAIEEFSGARSADGYLRFCRTSGKIHDVLIDAFISRQRPGFCGFARRAGPLGLLGFASVNPFASMWKTLHQYFDDPRLRQLFGRYATYYGASPFLAPAALIMIAHAEQQGVWRIDGGMRALAAALERLAVELGAEFRYSAKAVEIIRRGNRVSGIRLDSGDRLAADIVVVNGDVNAVASGQFGDDYRSAVPSGGRRSLSAMTWAGAAISNADWLQFHNVLFSNDYEAEFASIFGRGRFAAAPTVYICAPDRRENSQPPAGPERMFVLINAPAAVRGIDAQSRRRQCEIVQEQMARCGLAPDRDLDQFEMTTPADFERRYPASGGAIYGEASHGWHAAFRRAGSRTAMTGLYLAGGSVHPGAGVPVAALSGVLAAEAVILDLKKRRRTG